jgi:hypothetical protein
MPSGKEQLGCAEAWTHRRTSGGLPYQDGESYLRIQNGLALVHRGRNPKATAALAAQIGAEKERSPNRAC